MRISLFTLAPPPEKLLAALRASGHAVDIADPATFDHLPDDARPLIDESALANFAAAAAQLRDRRAVALIRHPHAAPRDLLPALHRIVATSEAVAGPLVDVERIDRSRIRIIAPGVDPAPRSTGSDGPGCAILTVGPVGPFDTVGALLLRALARLFDLDWSLTVATQDAWADGEITSLAATLGIGDRVHGADAAALATLWRQADLLVLTAPWNGEPPASIGKALRRGIPVIVTAEGLAASIVPPQAGLVCPPGDRDQLSRALRRLIFDPTLRHTYADAAFAAGAVLPDWPAQAALLAEALQ